MYKYQNVSDKQQILTVTGNISPRVVEPQETLVSDVVIENPNFKYVGEAESAGIQGVINQAGPGAVTEASRQDNETNKEIQ